MNAEVIYFVKRTLDEKDKTVKIERLFQRVKQIKDFWKVKKKKEKRIKLNELDE